MVIFNIKAQIEFLDYHQLTFENKFSFEDDGTEVVVMPKEKGLELTLTFEASNLEIATSIAEIRLMRISDILSWRYEIPIPEIGITGYNYAETDSDTREVFHRESITGKSRISVVKNLESKEIVELTAVLSQNYSSDAEEVQFMWKDAITEQSKSLKFLLLFRLLEWIIGGKEKARSKVDKYIKTSYPTVALEKGQYGEDISVFTYLRDNIHAKSKNFPFQQIEENLPDLQRIVKKAIQDHYKI